MEMTQSELIYVLLCCFAVYTFATFVQRVCGFGMGIVAILLLPLMSPSYSLPAAVTNACSAFSASYLAVKYRKNAVVRLVPPVLCGSFVMTFLTVRFSRGASLDTLRILLAVMLILMSLWFLFLSKKITIQPKVRNGVIAGGLGGIMNGLFATGGPPVVVFFLGATATHAAYFATIQTYFAFNNIYASAIRILNGHRTFFRIHIGIRDVPAHRIQCAVYHFLDSSAAQVRERQSVLFPHRPLLSHYFVKFRFPACCLLLHLHAFQLPDPSSRQLCACFASGHFADF